MKITSLLPIAISAGLLAGCGTANQTSSSKDTLPGLEHRTVEFTERSPSELPERMNQWQREGWAVLSISARLPQSDGTVHRKVELSHTRNPAFFARDYDDRQIAMIRRGETTEGQLLEWFGKPESRNATADGRASLRWSLGAKGKDSSSGILSVELVPEGKVAAYSAHRTSALREQALKRSDVGYDDNAIARIRRGETTEVQLMDWFGQPVRREAKLDGRTLLAWDFSRGANDQTLPGSALSVSLTSEGKVDAYSAHQ